MNFPLIHKTNLDKIEDYYLNAEHYYENSKETLKKKEFGKAGELLWGSVAETAKALHLKYYYKPINSHNQIRDFLESLSTIHRRNDLRIWSRAANSLHANFYETHLDESIFMEYYEQCEYLYAFLSNEILKPRKNPKSKKTKN